MGDPRQRRALQVLAGDTDPPLPLLGQVLYAPPNPDGTRKLCANCTFWQRPINGCRIVAALVQGNMVCGYHVFGAPPPPESYPPTAPAMVPPDLAGLIDAPPGGTSCDTCRFYRPQRGGDRCRAVRAFDSPQARVDALGCCTRWERQEG